MRQQSWRRNHKESSKLLKFLIRMMMPAVLVFCTVLIAQYALAGDLGGNKTGTAADVQNAEGNGIVIDQPIDQKAPDYADRLRDYKTYKVQAAKEPFAAQLADSVGVKPNRH